MFKINLILDTNILIKCDNPITSDQINSPIWHRLILLNKVYKYNKYNFAISRTCALIKLCANRQVFIILAIGY